jgi:hypothetical protein
MPKRLTVKKRQKWKAYVFEHESSAEQTPLTRVTIRSHLTGWMDQTVDPDNPDTEARIVEIRDDDVKLELPGGKYHSCPYREIIDAEAVIRFWISKGLAPVSSDFRLPDVAIAVRPISNHSYASTLAERIRRNLQSSEALA